MQTDDATSDQLTATELDQAGELDPAPEFAVEALDQAEQPTRATRPRRKRRNRGGRPSRLTIEIALKLGRARAGQSLEVAGSLPEWGSRASIAGPARGRGGDPRFRDTGHGEQGKGDQVDVEGVGLFVSFGGGAVLRLGWLFGAS